MARLETPRQLHITHNIIKSPKLPASFQGYTLLQISDLHVDMNLEVIERIESLVDKLHYDVCVLTGDFRGKTFGPIDATLRAMTDLREALKGKVYGVLGNHDTIAMVPALKAIGIRMLLNEHLARARPAVHSSCRSR